MPYYGQGDYYGQGGLGSFLGKVAKGALGFATGGPMGAIAAIRSVSPAVTPAAPSRFQTPAPQVIVQAPGIIPAIQRIVPGGATGLMVDPTTGMVKRRRRRMNYANGRALTRANRRVDGFVRLAKRSLKHTNYKIVSKSAGRSRPKTIVRESGPGSVHVG